MSDWSVLGHAVEKYSFLIVDGLDLLKIDRSFRSVEVVVNVEQQLQAVQVIFFYFKSLV